MESKMSETSSAPLIDRFMARVDKKDDCWLWTGTKGPHKDDYGVLLPKIWGEKTPHTWYYKHLFGEIPADKEVRQSCNVRLCVNPEHLKLHYKSEPKKRKLTKYEIPLIDQFMKNVKKCDSGCWEWIGAKHASGYGGLAKGMWKEAYAHRWCYIFHKGEIPEKKVVRHLCDNRICVNPEHLEIGNQADNVHDMYKGGKEGGNRKLTNTQIEELRKMRAEGKLIRELEAAFGITRTTVYKILQGTQGYLKELKPAGGAGEESTPTE